MTWLDKLERRIGFLAIPGLLRYVGFLTALVFVLEKVNPGYLNLLDLNPVAVMHGEVWRLVTYIFIPQMASMLPLPDWVNVAFYVLFLWWMGNGLESAWGAFRLTIFYLIGMIGTTVAAFFFGAAFSNFMLTTSLFFAFAQFYPDLVIYFAYILPRLDFSRDLAPANLRRFNAVSRRRHLRDGELFDLFRTEHHPRRPSSS
ncbi:MAG: hypothetical protein DME45_11425 [Verrucomicrobia bacterium]|nr:MAG: hypothetical protein DME45_11425 [Verrucomicrobiota bacterium]